MKIRHQLEAPEIEEAAEGMMKRIRENRWTPIIVTAVITLAATTACRKNTTIVINNYTGESLGKD